MGARAGDVVTDSRIIALDLSLTATGFCEGDRSEVWRTKLKGHERLQHILDALDSALYCVKPDAVFIEGFSFGSKGSSVYEIGGLGYLVRHRLWAQGIPYAEVSPSTLKKYATGRGNANKDEMLAAAIRRFNFPGTDNNAADAWLLWALGMAEMGTPIVDVPKAQAEAIKVTWEMGEPR
jgi:Holliday junction resolvasome RuvABC endonuclease subunit